MKIKKLNVEQLSRIVTKIIMENTDGNKRSRTSNPNRKVMKEQNLESRDMDDYDISKEKEMDTIGMYEEQLDELFDFEKLDDAYDVCIHTLWEESMKLDIALKGHYQEKDRDYLTRALFSKYMGVPDLDDFKKKKVINTIVNNAIK